MRVKRRLIIQASATIPRNASILVKSFTGFLSVKKLIKTRKRDLSKARSAAARPVRSDTVCLLL